MMGILLGAAWALGYVVDSHFLFPHLADVHISPIAAESRTVI